MTGDNFSSIRFGPSMYRVFRNIPNTDWNALCEFVDNSIQAMLDSSIKGSKGKINIEITNEFISITDYGPGFSQEDLLCGLEPARIPANVSELNEFGMGMKLAALYFGDRYSITTSDGKGASFRVVFDLDEVIQRNLYEIPVEKVLYTGESFTTIIIDKLSNSTKINVALQINQIRQKLSEVYSVFIGREQFEIVVNDIILVVPKITILNAPWFNDEHGFPREWIEDFHIYNGDFGISGYVGLLDPMSNTNRGFKLVRRGRVVAGIQEDVKPFVIFGSPGSHISKRLFGLIELHGFGISFNKSQLLDVTELDLLWKLLRDELNIREYSIIKQAKEFRVSKTSKIIPFKSTEFTGSLEIQKQKKSNETPILKERNSIILSIGSSDFEIFEGTQVGRFIQASNPEIIVRADFFILKPIRFKLVEILQTIGKIDKIELDKETTVELIDSLWPLLK